MLHSDKSLRFTPSEIDTCRQVGLDIHGVKSPEAFANSIEPWLDAVAEVRPDILDRLAQKIADKKGLKLPPRLTVVSVPPLPDSPVRS